MSLSHYVYRGAAFLWGIAALVVFTVRSYLDDRPPSSGSDSEQKRLLRDAQHRTWSLEDEAISGLHHDFLTLSSGLQLHYVSNGERKAAGNLVIFLHGFPDSWYIFSRFLSSPGLHATGAQLVALDLPGFGGSDDLGHYGPDEMLNTVSEAIVQLKAQYLILDDRSRCLLVGHDWGGLLSYRIAAETLGLVHRLVVVNIGYAGQMPVVGRNARLAIRTCQSHLTAWIRDPLKANLALSAWQSVAPLVTQMLMSSYIFMFNLPYAILTIMPLRTLEYLLDWCHREGHHRHKVASKPGHVSELFLAESRASSFGPGSAECTSRDHKNSTYSAAVLSRATTSPPGNWLQRIRLYREGLTSGKWTLAPELQRYRPAPEGEGETFKCPVTVLFGLQDPALDPRVVLDGVERYFTGATKVATGDGSHEKQGTSTASDAGASHIVRLYGCGHWSLLEDPIGSGTLEKTLVCLLSETNGADSGSLEEVLARRAQHDDLANRVTIVTHTKENFMPYRAT
ncbi:hypothetical protein B0A55_06528 [Friedmanniomyces simplex]|uniref:AB hydrolase-1 domain-containing protein n=1 Tax=Friedmanniomyces simplex TaxID=329884 RepID=A0A4U0X4A2_9PEZI|nr:hypothetical protein B0A55_06528 [Friedmanniomyces simplex]